MGSNLKRKRDGDTIKDSKTQEYLSLLQQPSKTRTWANDDQLPAPVETDSHTQEQEQPFDVDDQGELTYAQRKKAKLGQDANESSHDSVDAGHQSTIDESDGQPLPGKHEEESEDPQKDHAPVSDSDWLRSKTSRLLGLLDENEQETFAPPAAATNPTPIIDSNVEKLEAESPEKPAVSDLAKAPTAAEVDTNIENIRISARLFVRNLSYETKESELEPVFSPFGKIEEVMTLPCFVIQTHFIVQPSA